MSTLFDDAPKSFKEFMRILGETEGIPGLVRMVEDDRGSVNFRGEKDGMPLERYGAITELPLGLGWYQGITDSSREPKLHLTPKGWALLDGEDKRAREHAKLVPTG